ncbi:DUF2283 domain-containing protein [Candidatus Aerophobetes bacterium]|nr:DUF2283 domain-containing protein [Candidatus Aerophobetes bacterium]
MRITYDPKYDVLYLKLGQAEKVYCKEMDEDITMDSDAEGKLCDGDSFGIQIYESQRSTPGRNKKGGLF